MPLPKVTIRGLQALIAVYEEQSFSRAAERENATQSGMSTQVKNLEEALGTRLLTRKRGTAELTPAGRIVYDAGRKALHRLYDIQRQVEDVQAALTGTIRLGIIPSLTRSVLPRAMRRFQADFPQVDVSVLEEYSFSLMRRVLEGDLECAIVPSGDVLAGLTADYLATDHEVLVLSPDDLPHIPHLAEVRPRDLDGLKLILPSPRNIRRRGLGTFFEAHNVGIGAVLEMDGMLATLEMVAETGWSTVLPSVLCHRDLDGRQRKLHPLVDPGIATDYIVVTKTEKALSRAAGLLVDQLRSDTGTVLQEFSDATGRAT